MAWKSRNLTYSRINLRIPKEDLKRIKEVAALRSVTINSLIASAVGYYLEERHEQKGNEAYLLSLKRELKALKMDMELIGEMISFFVFHWFCYTPDLMEPHKKALLIDGKRRHERFLELLSKKVQKGDLSFSILSVFSEDESLEVEGESKIEET